MIKPLKANKVGSALRSKGFDKKDSKRHEKFVLYVDGKKTKIFTVMSRGHKEISKGLIKTMMKQLKFDDFKQFLDFVECPMTYEDYVTFLRKKGEI